MQGPFSQQNKSLHKIRSDTALPKNLKRTSGNLNHMSTLNEPNTINEQPSGKKIRPIRGVVVSAVRETPDTWTLNIFVGDNPKEYLAGQFISIAPHQFPEILDVTKYCEYKKGKKEPVRAYSITSAPHEKYISITIKPETYEPHPESFPPLLSPILASDILVGREIEFLGYSGGYVMPRDIMEHTDTVIHLVAGSGIVPSFSIIKDELINNKHTHSKHTLVYVNRSMNDIIFHRELLALEQQFTARLKIHYFLSQEQTKGMGPSYFSGRPTLEHVRNLCANTEKSLFFACGPALTKWQKKHATESGVAPKPRFMEWVHDVIDELKVDKKRFKREIYG
jgi:3-ketosteroid 9alpha-monooxygenase subunit B